MSDSSGDTAVTSYKTGNIVDSFWVRAKLAFLCLSFGGSFLNGDWSTGGAPFWVISAGATWMFVCMLLMQFTASSERWTERELWVVSPFRDFLSVRGQMAFFHFASINSIAAGWGVFAKAFFGFHDGMIFHGLLFLSVGAATWLGLRLGSLFPRKM